MFFKELETLKKEENKVSFEEQLPSLLNTSLTNVKNLKVENNYLKDCYLDELNSSINIAEIEYLISKEQAEYLRKKYLR